MSKLLSAFFEFKNEAEGTKRFALAAIAVITLSLAMLSISGAWAKSEAAGEWWQVALAFIPRFFYALLVFGLEMLAAVLFVRALIAAHWAQSAVCCVMLLFLAWANVQNSKDGVHFIMPTRFAATGETLRDQAGLANTRADEDKVERGKIDRADELRRLRADIAKLESEADLMTSNTRIREAQERLVLLGYYPADRVDGIRQEITLSAMAKRGEEIRTSLDLLRRQECNLTQCKDMTVAPVLVVAGGQAQPAPVPMIRDQRDLKIELEAQAREADASGWRLEIILWVAEIARSLGLWAAVASIRMGSNASTLRRREELEEEEHQNALAKLRGERTKAPEPIAEPITPAAAPEPVAEPEPIAASTPEPLPESHPEPVEAVSEPEPPSPPPPPELNQQQQWGREGGKQAAINRQAEEARKSRMLVIGPVSTLDALKVAAE